MLETVSGVRHDLAYAETPVVQATFGRYAVRSMDGAPVEVVKSLVG